MLVCSKCGGSNIQTLAWVDANTNKYVSDGNNTYEDRWCENCQSHINFVEQEFYLDDLDDEEFYDEIFG